MYSPLSHSNGSIRQSSMSVVHVKFSSKMTRFRGEDGCRRLSLFFSLDARPTPKEKRNKRLQEQKKRKRVVKTSFTLYARPQLPVPFTVSMEASEARFMVLASRGRSETWTSQSRTRSHAGAMHLSTLAFTIQEASAWSPCALKPFQRTFVVRNVGMLVDRRRSRAYFVPFSVGLKSKEVVTSSYGHEARTSVETRFPSQSGHLASETRTARGDNHLDTHDLLDLALKVISPVLR